MILLLGKHNNIVEYAKNTFKIDESDIFCCPDVTTHHTEFGKYVDTIRNENPAIITTQSLEMLDVLLESDLEFEVIRTRRFDDGIRTAKTTKEEVVGCRNVWNFDPRD